MKGRHHRVLQEAPLQDDCLPVAQATLSQLAPLIVRVRARAAPGPAVRGTAAARCGPPATGPRPWSGWGDLRRLRRTPARFLLGAPASPRPALPWSSCRNRSSPRSRSAAPRPPTKATMPRPAHRPGYGPPPGTASPSAPALTASRRLRVRRAHDATPRAPAVALHGNLSSGRRPVPVPERDQTARRSASRSIMRCWLMIYGTLA